jgi:DNA repair photolyase
MVHDPPLDRHGRGAQADPPNRFAAWREEADYEHLTSADDLEERPVKTQFIVDRSRSIVSENDSPDVPFRFSVNPYRGCEHGCAYCYARPTHEYLGYNAGLDFESRIMVKEQAPELLRDWLARDGYRPELIAFSGVTDCYQPAERRFELTRRCLQVAADCGQPIGIVTKNALVARDIDILQRMAKQRTVRVMLSVTTLDAELAHTLEPRTSSPIAKLRTIQELSSAGIETVVMVAPIIPGLNDNEMPAILNAAKAAGAVSAHFILLRLPLTVRPVFTDWLAKAVPTKKDKIESLIRQCRDGELNNSEFGTRMRGQGNIAEQIAQSFKVFARKYELDRKLPPLETQHFRPPVPTSGQLRLF